MSYQSTTIVGNLGSDPELRYLTNGNPVTNFSVAVNDGYGEEKRVTWFRVSVYGNQAEPCNQYLSKGRQVLVVGRLKPDESGNPRTFTRKDGTAGASYELVAQLVKFIGVSGELEATDDGGNIPF